MADPQKKKPMSAKRLAYEEQRRADKKAKHEANKIGYRQLRKERHAVLKVNISGVDFDPTLDYAGYKFTEAQVRTFFNLVSRRVPVHQMGDKFGLPNAQYMWMAIGVEGHPINEAYNRGKAKSVADLEERVESLGRRAQLAKLKTVRQRDGAYGYTEVEVREVDRSPIAIDVHKWTLGHYRPDKHGKNAIAGTGEKNEQLEALFQALMKGPVE
jgi:hypothetical protein